MSKANSPGKNKLSIVIPAPSSLKGKVPVIEHLLKLFLTSNFREIKKRYNLRVEIIVSYGACPSIQRNRAVEKACGRVIYFLDSDAFPGLENFEIIGRTWFSYSAYNRDNIISIESENTILGGPSLTPIGCTFYQLAETLAFTSKFGGASVKARYSRHGSRRSATENDLILCNMAMTKSLFKIAGGFNELLYPNEENEFMQRAQKLSGRLCYDPDFSVARYQRPHIKAFAKQLFNYGRGRADQFFQEGTIGNPDRLVPLGFTFFLLIYPVLNNGLKRVARFILMLYSGLALGFAIKGASDLKEKRVYFSTALDEFQVNSATSKKKFGLAFFSAILFPIMHISYGSGMAWGVAMNLLKRQKSFSKKVELEIK